MAARERVEVCEREIARKTGGERERKRTREEEKNVE
jgi:hypothetical protein